jgi:hypothetical protein
VSTPQTGPGETPGPRDWREMPPTHQYELRITLANEVVEAIRISRGEYYDLKRLIGDMRDEQHIRLLPTLTWGILGKRAISLLAGASLAMLYLKWHGYLAVSWWLAATPFLGVVVARLAWSGILRLRRGRRPE